MTMAMTGLRCCNEVEFAVDVWPPSSIAAVATHQLQHAQPSRTCSHSHQDLVLLREAAKPGHGSTAVHLAGSIVALHGRSLL